MPIFKSTTPAVPTTEERLAALGARQGSALSIFRDAANELVAVADEQEAIAAETYVEIDRLEDVAHAAQTSADDNRDAADRIQQLFG